MSLVQPEDVIAQVAVGVDGATLQAVIDREEAWLAHRIGALTEERSQSFWPGVNSTVRLLRPTDAVLVVGLDPTQVVLSPDGWYVTVGYWPASPVAITYTPTDELEVRQAVIELCRITLTNSPYQTESADVHSYGRSASPDSLRDAIARRLIRPPGTGGLMTATVPFHDLSPTWVEPS